MLFFSVAAVLAFAEGRESGEAGSDRECYQKTS